MTNFEKWKEELTVDDLCSINDIAEGSGICSIYLSRKECDGDSGACNYCQCSVDLREWAEQEAEK
ncbi:hypothetical protein [Eubacterium sp.]|uniref:hypothetical protein n=1 Tax=Eubacterium sp. TaxID=142586 RepID=UPI002FC70F9C